MGGTAWSDDHYTAAAKARSARSGVSSFEYDRKVKSGKAAAKTHNKLDPMGVKCRESRDSDAHPTSNGISVWFDHTGSMHNIPRTLQSKLPKLMGTLLRRGCIEHPQIQMNAVGDSRYDKAPIQIGQFESGVEMDEDLNNMLLEGGGGGQGHESYELALYFMARHTELDCFTKRGKKGYLFLLGDEKAYDPVCHKEVKRVFGDTIQDIPLTDIIAEVSERYNVYFIIPVKASGGRDKTLVSYWAKLFGQNVIQLEDENLVCETIAGTIAINEGVVEDFDELAVDLDIDATSVDTVTRALTTIKPSGSAVTNVSGGTLKTSGSAKDAGVETI